MKILIVRMWPYELNIYNYNCQEIGLAKSLIKKGNTCDIVLYTDGESREEDYSFDDNKKIHIYYLKAKNILKNCFYEKKLYKIIEKYDVVQSSEYDQLSNIKLFKKLGNKLTIYHGPYKSKYTKGYNIKCKISDFIITFFPKYRKVKIITKSLLAKEFLNEKNFNNIYNIGVGLDTERFDNCKENKDINELIEEKDNNKYYLYIGRIEERRSILFLLSVFKKVFEKNKKIKLIIVGNGEKNYTDKCMNYIKENNLNDNIYYFKSLNQDELPNLYDCCDVFVLPTQYEIFGMVLLEALYFNLKVITTYNGGSSMLINEKNGIICESNNFNDWYNAINNLANRSKNNKGNMKELTWDYLVKKFLEAYKES